VTALVRPLVLAMLAVVASFVLALWVSQSRLRSVEEEVYAVAANAEPSVVHLDAARDALDRLLSGADEYVEALAVESGSAAILRDKMILARQSLYRSVDAYARLPFFEGEREIYDELRAALDPLDKAVRDLMRSPQSIAEARATLSQTVVPNGDLVASAIGRIIELDTHQVHVRLESIAAARRAATNVALGLGSVALLLACASSALAVRATMREASRQQAIEVERSTRQRAEEELRARDDFLALATHELRTPLTALQLVLLRLRRRPESCAALLPRAERQVRRLSDLVEELIDVAHINLGRLSLERTDVDLAELVREVVSERTPDAKRSSVTLAVAGDSSVVGRWDRSLIMHVVSNLLSNAMKFGQGAPVEVEIARHDGDARLLVRDHGIGIPPGRLPFVFDLYERAASARHFGGLGVGLFVVRALVEAHHGHVRVQSEPGNGSTFTVDLPLASTPA
jgi:signal transduction histidine kinase